MNYHYNNYQSPSSLSSSQQYSPPLPQQNPHQSPIFNYDSVSTTSSSLNSNYGQYGYSSHSMRYYLSKLFDVEDDLEFCPEIPEHNSPSMRKFNPYTASVFSPGSNNTASTISINTTPVGTPMGGTNSNPSSPRVSTPRIRKPIEIVNPQTKLRINSPASK